MKEKLWWQDNSGYCGEFGQGLKDGIMYRYHPGQFFDEMSRREKAEEKYLLAHPFVPQLPPRSAEYQRGFDYAKDWMIDCF